MAVLDFRNGGYDRTHPSQGRDYRYSQQADYGYDDPSLAQAQPAGSLATRAARFLNYFGAMVSVGLILFLLIWGYQLVMRDVSGVPVIRALEGEARTAPDNPGGEATRYTGLGVNSVAGGAAATSDEVAIAPAATSLDDSDVAMGTFGATAQEAVIEPELAVAPTPTIIPEGVEMPVNEAVTEVATSVVDGEVHETSQDEAIANAMQEAMAEKAPVAHAVAASARPASRPRNLRVASAAPAPAAVAAPEPAPAAAPPVAETKVASGTILAQIGALDSKADAERHWSKVSGKHSSLFSGKGQVIQNAQTGGRNFVRLRVSGFADMADARRFCAALIAEGTDCIPTSVK